jgi:hypothetical protein
MPACGKQAGGTGSQQTTGVPPAVMGRQAARQAGSQSARQAGLPLTGGAAHFIQPNSCWLSDHPPLEQHEPSMHVSLAALQQAPPAPPHKSAEDRAEEHVGCGKWDAGWCGMRVEPAASAHTFSRLCNWVAGCVDYLTHLQQHTRAMQCGKTTQGCSS